MATQGKIKHDYLSKHLLTSWTSCQNFSVWRSTCPPGRASMTEEKEMDLPHIWTSHFWLILPSALQTLCQRPTLSTWRIFNLLYHALMILWSSPRLYQILSGNVKNTFRWELPMLPNQVAQRSISIGRMKMAMEMEGSLFPTSKNSIQILSMPTASSI